MYGAFEWLLDYLRRAKGAIVAPQQRNEWFPPPSSLSRPRWPHVGPQAAQIQNGEDISVKLRGKLLVLVCLLAAQEAVDHDPNDA